MDRDNCFETTLVHLTERFNGKDVYLVGTSNQSTMLAQRTQKLIEEIKPDKVLVQTSPEWWSNARLLKYVDCQEELNKYASELDRHSNYQTIDYYNSNRRWSQLMRLGAYASLFRWHFGFRENFAPMRPGLEVKYACDAAEKVGAKIEFMGSEMDQTTW